MEDFLKTMLNASFKENHEVFVIILSALWLNYLQINIHFYYEGRGIELQITILF